jgi:hypothetical protein
MPLLLQVVIIGSENIPSADGYYLVERDRTVEKKYRDTARPIMAVRLHKAKDN